MGVGIGSGTGASVDVGSDVGGLAGVGVPVGDGITTEVAIIPAADVPVEDGNAGAVIVDALDVDVPVDDAIGGATVVATSLVAVEEIVVLVGLGVPACGAFAGVQNSKQINISKRMIATINLNRS